MTLMQAKLSELMREISEECYCAGWLIDLEYDLWEMLLGGRRDYGMGHVSEESIEIMRGLSKLLGGWVVWDDGVGGEQWVSMPVWLSMVSVRKIAKRRQL